MSCENPIFAGDIPLAGPLAGGETVLGLQAGAVRRLPVEAFAGGGSGGDRQEVFLGAPAVLPAYPALVFEAVTIAGQTSYRMRFNDGAA